MHFISLRLWQMNRESLFFKPLCLQAIEIIFSRNGSWKGAYSCFYHWRFVLDCRFCHHSVGCSFSSLISFHHSYSLILQMTSFMCLGNMTGFKELQVTSFFCGLALERKDRLSSPNIYSQLPATLSHLWVIYLVWGEWSTLIGLDMSLWCYAKQTVIAKVVYM